MDKNNTTKKNSQQNDLLENLDLVLDRLNDGLILLSITGKIFYINDFLLKLGGYTKDDLVGKNAMMLANIFSPSDLKKIAGSFLKARKGVSGERYEVEAKTKQGEKKNLEFATSVVKKDGRILGIVVVARDLTERKKLEVIIKESVERFKLFFNDNVDVIFVADPKTKKLTDCNKAAKKLLGYSQKEILSMTADQLHPKDLAKEVIEDFEKQAQGDVGVFETQVLTKTGKRIPVEISTSTISIGGKDLFVGTFRDISESKKAENRYQALFNSSQDAVMTIEPPTWKFTSGNLAAIKLYGVKDEKEFTTLGPWDVSSEYQPDGQLSTDKAKAMIKKAMEEGSKFFEWTHKKFRGADFPTTVLLSRMKIGDKTFLQATVRDITKQKENEKALAEKVKDLERMNKVMTGRELKMVELKKEIQELKRKSK